VQRALLEISAEHPGADRRAALVDTVQETLEGLERQVAGQHEGCQQTGRLGARRRQVAQIDRGGQPAVVVEIVPAVLPRGRLRRGISGRDQPATTQLRRVQDDRRVVAEAPGVVRVASAQHLGDEAPFANVDQPHRDNLPLRTGASDGSGNETPYCIVW
jgi:hypothetical protein